mmetsp:Transcript_2688/g.4207  ORF Transcript_2688/g.4207 Transcript_2688/m.4207 type:complete len:115 (+) Transcript_2688:2095-2439(+)
MNYRGDNDSAYYTDEFEDCEPKCEDEEDDDEDVDMGGLFGDDEDDFGSERMECLPPMAPPQLLQMADSKNQNSRCNSSVGESISEKEEEKEIEMPPVTNQNKKKKKNKKKEKKM